MRYGIFSDVHGNWEALSEALRFYEREGISEFLCLGDIVGYGANPKECLGQIRAMNTACVAGNHDWAVSGRLNYDNFHQSARLAIEWTQHQLDGDDMEFLNNLSLVFKNDDVLAVHGTLNEPEQFHYLLYMSDADEMFHLMDRNICFVGHSHVPQIIKHSQEQSTCLKSHDVVVNPLEKYIINVGSVGQPRDGDPRVSCCVYDTEARRAQIYRLTYDIQTAQTKILNAGLPKDLARRLSVGM